MINAIIISKHNGMKLELAYVASSLWRVFLSKQTAEKPPKNPPRIADARRLKILEQD